MNCKEQAAVYRKAVEGSEYFNSPLLYKDNGFLETDYTVLEIALECGYENVSYFIRLFHKLMHCTPLQYRLLNQKQ